MIERKPRANQYIDSVISESVKIYKNVDIRKSIVNSNVSLGDDTFLLESTLESNIAINKRNHLQNSKIGRFTYTGVNTVIRFAEVGRFCSISWNVSIGGKNHDYDNATTNSKWWFHKLDSGESKKGTDYAKRGSCIIGNDVWIATNAIVLRNVKVGNGSIIGAGAIVNKDVEPYSIVAGVPAQKKKMRFDDKTIAALEEIQWWNWPIETIRENLDLIYSTKVDSEVLKKMYKISKMLG